MLAVDDLVTQAYAAWDLLELERAAELFEAAAIAEAEAAATRAGGRQLSRLLFADLQTRDKANDRDGKGTPSASAAAVFRL